MARKKTISDTLGVTDPEGDLLEVAKRNAAADAALAKALAARDATSETKEPPKPLTLGDQFTTIAETLAYAKRMFKLNEATLIKLWELTLMWELNNRQNQQRPSFPVQEYTGGSGDEGEGSPDKVDLPEPTEVLGTDTPNEE